MTMWPIASSGKALPELRKVRRAILVVDIAESVRLIQVHEADFINRWRSFVHEIRTELLPLHGGRLVKSLGDGMLLEFESVSCSVAVALNMQHRIAASNVGLPLSAALLLRMGIHVGDIVVDDLDSFGPAVNLAARLAGLGRPGEIIVSAEVRQHIAVGLDADVEDMGDCWLKHVDEPVRAARLLPMGLVRPILNPHYSRGAQETIGVAVLPFTARIPAAATQALGELIADDTIAQLSRLPQLRVISRLSTAVFSGRQASLKEITTVLDVQYVVFGSYLCRGSEVRIDVQVVEREGGATIWAETFATTQHDIMAGSDVLVDRMVAGICAQLVGAEVRRACTQALPTLSSYTILLGAIAQLHSLAVCEFDQAREMLVYLTERHPALPTPRAWLGLWHVMRVGQGWSADAAQDAAKASQFIHVALDMDPGHALSLAIDGLVAAYVRKDLARAGERYDAALRANPNEGLAWLFRSAWHAYREEGDEGVAAALRAQSLSPLDPMRYYYDNFTSTALLAQGNLAGAIEYGRRSLRANRVHGPTLRILAIAHALSDDMDEARSMVGKMLELEPSFTVSAFRERYPGQRAAQVDRYAGALTAAGLPA